MVNSDFSITFAVAADGFVATHRVEESPGNTEHHIS